MVDARTAVLQLASGTNRFLTWAKRSRQVPAGGAPVRLNLGGGLEVTPGWINVDASLHALLGALPPFASGIGYRLTRSSSHYSRQEYLDAISKQRFVHHDLRYGIPFPDNCAEFIYIQHCIVYFSRHEGLDLLREAWRVLHRNGVIRISTPDLAHVMSLYSDGDKEAAMDLLFGDEPGNSLHHRRAYYDFEMLKRLLSEASFADITSCEPFEGRTPDLTSLDNRPENCLFIEGRKASG